VLALQGCPVALITLNHSHNKNAIPRQAKTVDKWHNNRGKDFSKKSWQVYAALHHFCRVTDTGAFVTWGATEVVQL
jgi:hypothetical protein